MNDIPTENEKEKAQHSSVQPQQVDDIEQSEQESKAEGTTDLSDPLAGGKELDNAGSEDEVDGLVSDAGKDEASSKVDDGREKDHDVSIGNDETVVQSEMATDISAAQAEPTPQAITEDSLQQHNEASKSTASSESTPAATVSSLPLKEALPSSFARIPSPALSATSSSTPATAAPTAPKKFSSVNVNKKFLSKAASPSPGPAGSATGGSPIGSPAATAAKPIGSLGGELPDADISNGRI